jgi:hypothetical protein
VDERSTRIAGRFELPMLVAAVLVVLVIVIQESALAPTLRPAADVLNVVIWLAFLAETVTMLAVVPSRGHWLIKHPLDIAIVLFTGPFLPASLQSIRVLRILRVLRVYKLVPSARMAS